MIEKYFSSDIKKKIFIVCLLIIISILMSSKFKNNNIEFYRNSRKNSIDNTDIDDDSEDDYQENLVYHNTFNLRRQNNINKENRSNLDYFGFKKIYDGASQKSVGQKNYIYSKLFYIFSFFILLIVILFILTISGFIAWKEFGDDPFWIKIIKTWIAIIFSPIFLSYIFMKSVLYNINSYTINKNIGK